MKSVAMHVVRVGWGILAALVLNACAPIIYAPPVPQGTLFRSAGEVQAAVHTNGADVEGYVAFSPLPHVSLFGSGSLAFGKVHRHRFAGGGVGTYWSLGRYAVLELLAGWGRGTLGATEQPSCSILFPSSCSPEYQVQGQYERIFGQINFGARPRPPEDRRLIVGLAMRFAHVRAYDLEARPSDPTETAEVFFEPALFGRLHVAYGLSIASTLGASVGAFPGYYGHRGLYMSIGLHADLRQLLGR